MAHIGGRADQQYSNQDFMPDLVSISSVSVPKKLRTRESVECYPLYSLLLAANIAHKVDLLSPASEVGEERYDAYLASTPSCQRLPPPPPCRGRSEGDGGGHHGQTHVGGNSSVDSLSSLLSHLHHQESVL